MNKYQIIGVMCFVIGIILIIFSPTLIDETPEMVEVECYDNYNHLIVGLNCIEEIYDNQLILFSLAFSSALIIIIGMCLLSYGTRKP